MSAGEGDDRLTQDLMHAGWQHRTCCGRFMLERSAAPPLAARQALEFVKERGVQGLNVVGPRASGEPRAYSLRAMYRRAPTLIEHQQLACETLGFRWLSEHHRRGLVRALRNELTRTDDPPRLLGFARRWLCDHRLIIVHERRLRAMIAPARRITESVEPSLLAQWRATRRKSHRPALQKKRPPVRAKPSKFSHHYSNLQGSEHVD